MKKLLAILILVATIPCFSQSKVDSLVEKGIEHHDRGEYDKAIQIYNEALKIDPKSILVNYELAMTYMYAGKNKEAIKHSNIVIKQNKDYLPPYIVKGSSLSNSGKVKKAIKLFKKSVEKFGDNYLLYYNLGISYYKILDFENAEENFIKAIVDLPNHNSSHFILSNLKHQQNERVQSLLGLYYFLLLEPSSTRSTSAYYLLKEQLRGSVHKDEESPTNINILIDSSRMDSEFSPAEMLLALLEASDSLDENKVKTEDELFIEKTKNFFLTLGELKDDSKSSNIWWEYYVPFFYDLANSEYLDVFCYYISISSNENAREWLSINSEKLEEFVKWVNNNL